jgi:hypothetical protein
MSELSDIIAGHGHREREPGIARCECGWSQTADDIVRAHAEHVALTIEAEGMSVVELRVPLSQLDMSIVQGDAEAANRLAKLIQDNHSEFVTFSNRYRIAGAILEDGWTRDE